MKRKFLLALGLFLMIGILSACGKDAGSGTNSTKTNEPVGFMELAQDDETRVWYKVDVNDHVVTKDSNILEVYIVRKGKITTYSLANIYDEDLKKMSLTLRDIEKMTDEEVVEKIKDAEKENFKYLLLAFQDIIEYQINVSEEQSHSSNREYAEKEQTYLKDYYSKVLSEVTYDDISSKNTKTTAKSFVKTDASGNNVIGQALFYKERDLDVSYGYSRDLKRDFETQAKEELEDKLSIKEKSRILGYPIQVQIYDTVYLGFDNRSESDSTIFDALITRSLPEDTILGFDNLDTENVEEGKF